MGNQELEKILAKLRSADVRGWTCKGNLNPTADSEYKYWWPALSINLGELSFMLQKTERGNAIRTVYDYTLAVLIDDCFTIDCYAEGSDKTEDTKPIGNLYNVVYDDLKKIREQEFTERINNFLADTEQHSYKPKIEKVAAKLGELDLTRWKKHSYLNMGTTFTIQSHGLIFTLRTDIKYGVIKKDVTYHYLTIDNYEDDFYVKYKNTNPESLEEKEISRLYNKLDSALNTYYQEKLKEKMNFLLSE